MTLPLWEVLKVYSKYKKTAAVIWVLDVRRLRLIRARLYLAPLSVEASREVTMASSFLYGRGQFKLESIGVL
jgi:hypothetical protein